MVRRTRKGEFTPKNPQKYKGKLPILFRSSWELTVMTKFDQHPNVLEWASESISIPYQNPLTGKFTMYVPDFLVKYVDKTGKTHVEIIEVKPIRETLKEKTKTKADKAAYVVNQVKWAAAQAWCKRNKITFRVLTEEQIYKGYK